MMVKNISTICLYSRYAKRCKDLSLKFLPYSLLISILFSTIISLIYAKLIKNNVQEIQIVTDKMMKLDKKYV